MVPRGGDNFNEIVYKEVIVAENLAMMSRISQADLITNVERSSLVRGNYKQDAGQKSAFEQILEQEESRIRQQRSGGVGQKETLDNRMEGKVHLYDHRGMLGYFQMTISMTDLKG